MAMICKPENFLATLKDLRRELALCQEELSHALGVSFATVNRWENGKTVPSKLVQRHFEQFCKEKDIKPPFGKPSGKNKQDNAE